MSMFYSSAKGKNDPEGDLEINKAAIVSTESEEPGPVG